MISLVISAIYSRDLSRLPGLLSLVSRFDWLCCVYFKPLTVKAVIVSALVLLIFAQILLLVFGRGDRKFVTMILNITSAVIAAIGAITAFTACGNWKDLTDDINEDLDDEWDVEVGYSWYLMLFSGLFSLGVAAIAAIMLFTQKRFSEGEEPLNKA